MKIQHLFTSARSATFAFLDGGLYETKKAYQLTLNGEPHCEATTVVTSLFGLQPSTKYELEVWDEDECIAGEQFETKAESYTLNVRRFGAAGDGVKDDTASIQAAIMSCPANGRVLIPKGKYAVLPLFLKSNIRIEIQKGAELQLVKDRRQFPILPGVTESTDEESELYLGTWEGNPLDMFGALITGIEVENVDIYGEGILNGQADQSDWWQTPKVRRGAWRGRLFFLCRSKNVHVQGIGFQNSPSWNVHPYFSQNLGFYNISITAPANSPNTDGFDPESCSDVVVAGAHFSLGDDCIALKSGKLYMGRKYKTPCENLEIMHCLMENGHGGVTIGSEIAGGARNVAVHDCVMRHTDRGLRIKTRRGRGKDSVIDNIRFENVQMDYVRAPIVINCLYFCDPDGHSPYVQTRESLPVDDRTPTIGNLEFRNVHADNCSSCAAYFLGLPEHKIKSIRLENVEFNYTQDKDIQPMEPVMAEGVELCYKRGIIAKNMEHLYCKNVRLNGYEGELLDCENVEHSDWEEYK
ncbi:MAG: glycoside hydrolase family 28 protein [Clostridiales bacterium]|nr:glycoside hydrolase family 28 protein [Clostridiales bacterium]